MAIEEALFARLQAVSAVTDLVGARVYPAPVPQGATFPAVSYQRISGPREHAMGSDPGLAGPRFQVDSWAESYSEAVELAAAVRAALQRFRGTVSGEEVLDIFIENEQDRYENDRKMHRVRQDWTIWHRE